ncbi:hypothetical protein RDI58_014809 [Solanum bulbocastanum]|uniref:Uncharacterized protein n=1 Tax=Solanum bulbocastanum TaxID=147425 RepID=A0AAN8TE48_SOLBU
MNYSDIKAPEGDLTLFKLSTYNNGVLRVTWTEDEVKRINTLENLQYAVIAKFS